MATSVSGVTSHFPEAENGFTTTTAGSVSSGAATVTLNSVAGYTNGKPVVLVIDPTDPAKKQTFTGIVDTSGVQITSVVWTAGTNQTHALGATVVDYATATHISMISKGIEVSHDQDGTLKAGAVDVTAVLADDVVTGAKVASDSIEDDNIKSSTANSLRSRNLLYNGNMNVWQRNTSATPNDDVYSGADRWNFLTETNGAWTVARDTDVPVGSQYSMKFTNVTLNNQCAIVQILEALDTKQLDDGTVSLSFYAKTSSTEIANLRAGIITWGSTADSVTSDVFSTWAQDGTNPTLATNWSFENTPSNLALTSTWTRYTIENVAVDTATVNNLAVVIWTDDGTIAANDDFWITQIQLNYGAKASAFQHTSYETELARCQRYYEVGGYGIFGTISSATEMKVQWQFKVMKRVTPAIALLTTAPAMEESTLAVRTGSSSTLTASGGDVSGAYADINGFSSMTALRTSHSLQTNLLSAVAEL